jgi:hypothetical protein
MELKYTDYQTAIQSRFEKTENVKIYVFKPLMPPCCREWEANVLKPAMEKFPMFEWHIVITDLSHNQIPFPPADVTCYFVAPGAEILHFIRPGQVELPQLIKECEKFLRIHNGEFYSDVL